MMEKIYAGTCVNCSDQGYLIQLNQWTRDIANEIAKEEKVKMTDKHWEVIDYLQEQCRNGVTLTIRKVGKVV
jgi:tRNA 2-thiouridine synthesizing protein E